MTTIQSLRLMAEGNASLTSEETYAYLTRAASELSALQRSLNGIKQEAQGYKDDHLKCVHWCCENGLGESTDNATDEVLKQLSALQKENSELKQCFPNIGKDPLKASGDERKKLHEQTRERLKQACVLQQNGVPDQTALVWRIDLDRVSMDLIIAENRLAAYMKENESLRTKNLELEKNKTRLKTFADMVWDVRWPDSHAHDHIFGIAAEIRSSNYDSIDKALALQPEK